MPSSPQNDNNTRKLDSSLSIVSNNRAPMSKVQLDWAKQASPIDQALQTEENPYKQNKTITDTNGEGQ